MGVCKSNEDMTEQIKEAIEDEEAGEGSQTSSPVREDPEKLAQILKNLNEVVDLSKYQRDDYIAPLSQKHYDQNQVQAVKYWERKKSTKSVPPNAQAGGQQGRVSFKLKPVQVKR